MTPLIASPTGIGLISEVSFDGRGCALFSSCRRYRYALSREWDASLLGSKERSLAIFVGLNPSSAGAFEDDMTITKEIGFASRMGATALLKVNLYGFISTDPKGLVAAADPAGQGFDAAVMHVLLHSPRVFMPTKIVVAWGAHPMATPRRISQVIAHLPGPHLCLGTTADGSPRHPSRLAYATPVERWKGAP